MATRTSDFVETLNTQNAMDTHDKRKVKCQNRVIY